MLKARSGSDTTARMIAQPLHEKTDRASAATSHTAATHLEVTQSQLTTVDGPDTEQPQGLEAITNTESSAARNARMPKTSAIDLVARSAGLRGPGTSQVY
jgi:hypothetical protein